MKYFTLLLLFLTFGFKSFSQGEFPKYSTDSATGQKVVEFTIQQAQRVDNDLDLLAVMEKMQLGCDTVVKTYKIVVTDLGHVIAIQDVKINELDSLNTDNNKIISNLNDQIKKYIDDQIKSGELLKNKDSEIGIKDKQILTLKIHKIAGYTIAGGIGAAVLAGLIYGFVSGHLVIK